MLLTYDVDYLHQHDQKYSQEVAQLTFTRQIKLQMLLVGFFSTEKGRKHVTDSIARALELTPAALNNNSRYFFSSLSR